MTYIIISFNVEGWMAAAQKKTWQHVEKKKVARYRLCSRLFAGGVPPVPR